jgi:hypothetical protein
VAGSTIASQSLETIFDSLPNKPLDHQELDTLSLERGGRVRI